MLLEVLDKYCQSVGRRWTRRAALSALLLFRMGRSVFQDDASAYLFLSDAFRAYSPEIRRGAQGDPELSGLVSLSGAYDKTRFSRKTRKRLREIANELLKSRGKRHAKAADLEGPAEPQAQSAFSGFFGDLSNGRFAQDPWLKRPYERLRGLPHYVARARKGRRARPGRK